MIIEQSSFFNLMIDILIILAFVAYIIVTTIIQMKIAKKTHWVTSFIIPLITSILIFVTIGNIHLFWIFTFFSFGYYLLVYNIKYYQKQSKKSEQNKVNIKDLWLDCIGYFQQSFSTVFFISKKQLS